MAFVYEKIRDEDKEWVDFGRFKDYRNKPYIVSKYSSWTVDREEKAALVIVSGNGARPEDVEYETLVCGLYMKGYYVNFDISYKDYKNPSGTYTRNWFNLAFNTVSEEQNAEVVLTIKEALVEYSKSCTYDEHHATFNF
jgi:hypothetical protein